MNGRRLYEEIGGVDERYLQQAAAYRARKQAPAWRALLIAAALVLVGSLLVGTLALSIGVGVVGGMIMDELIPPTNDQQPPQSEAPIYSIAEMEKSIAQRQQGIIPLEQEKVPLFGGDAQLIWTDGVSGDYYRVSLTRDECNAILSLMQKEQKDIGEHSEQPSYQIWVSLGDGTVISPYLKVNAGNTGHGELFDYDPEIELSEQMIKQIMRCVEP
jgi:hypothetical protein